jgi:hypothetical protein
LLNNSDSPDLNETSPEKKAWQQDFLYQTRNAHQSFIYHYHSDYWRGSVTAGYTAVIELAIFAAG